MNPATILALVNVALLLVEKIQPVVAALRQSKELTPAQEAELDAKIASLTDQAHWQV